MEKVSIIINCHNGEKYLKECILSALNQEYKNFEIIFFDNFSSDNSKKIIEEFDNNIIKYFFSDKKLSLYAARNEAIKRSSGSLIAFLDTDDSWSKDYLSSKKKFFKNKNYDYFYSNVLIYYEKKKIFKKYKNFTFPDGIIYDYLVKDYFIIISGLIIRKKILKKEKYFNKNYNIIGDYDLVMRISKYAYAKAFNKPLVCYRVHEKNFSKLNNMMYYYEYQNWFNNQLKSNNKNFQKNKKIFLFNLVKLEIIYLLSKKKTFKLLTKIISFPNIILKLKFLFAFFLPIKLINFFRK